MFMSIVVRCSYTFAPNRYLENRLGLPTPVGSKTSCANDLRVMEEWMSAEDQLFNTSNLIDSIIIMK